MCQLDEDFSSRREHSISSGDDPEVREQSYWRRELDLDQLVFLYFCTKGRLRAKDYYITSQGDLYKYEEIVALHAPKRPRVASKSKRLRDFRQGNIGELERRK